ncbi:MAG: family 10 glycosylhydrolase [Armatimonadetes bacterium]|nr:family 10 glycosylhydrolase [Armatimonadota bacterium]
MSLSRLSGWILAAVLALSALRAQPVLVVEDTGAEGLHDTYVRGSLVRRALRRAGLEFDVRQDTRLPGFVPRGVKIVVLPNNPSLTPEAAEWLRRFAAGGGKLLIFPPVPELLCGLVGVADAGSQTADDDRRLSEIAFNQVREPTLPDRWRQHDWGWQPFTAAPNAIVVGRWRSPVGQWDETPAVSMTELGAFVGFSFDGDERDDEARLLLALATHYHPALWHIALPRILGSVGQVGSAGSLTAIRAELSSAALRPQRRMQAEKALTAATERLARARSVYREGYRLATAPLPKALAPAAAIPSAAERYLPAADLAWQAQMAAEQAWYLSQVGRAGEFRGVWLQNAHGVPRFEWPRTILALKENNFNALLINAANGGYADYPSRVLPHLAGAVEDPLAEALQQCHQAGIECHVWVMCSFLRPRTSRAYVETLRAAGRLQCDRDGKPLPWLRPSDPRNRQMLADLCAELARRYPIDGIHLDYLRYAPEGDYSEAERRAFEQDTHITVEHWPADVLQPGYVLSEWIAWRRTQVSATMQAISEAARAANPKIRLSAAVWPIWTDARLAVGQDPAAWGRHRWVDFLCPMNYQTEDSTYLRYLTVQQREVGEEVPVYPGIAAWRHESPAETITQIRAVRERGMPGFVLFHLDRRLVHEWLPALRLGLTGPEPWLGPAAP